MYKKKLKKIKKTFCSFFWTLLTTFFVACSGGKQLEKIAKEQQIHVEPNPLQVHGRAVHFKVSALLPPKLLQKATTYQATFFYTDLNPQKKQGFMEQVGNMTFKTDDYLKESKQALQEKEFSFAYEATKSEGNLLMKGWLQKGRKKQETPYFVLAKGLITTSLFCKNVLENLPADLAGKYALTATTQLPLDAQVAVLQEPTIFFFEKNNTTLSASKQRDSLVIAFLQNYFAKQKQAICKIKASFSVEGDENNNLILAQQRAENLREYLKILFAKYAPEIKPVFQIQAVATFQERKEELKFYSKAYFEKNISDQISQIIDNARDFASINAIFQGKSYYSVFLTEIYPRMRYARIEAGERVFQISDNERLKRNLDNKKWDAALFIYKEIIAKNDHPAAHNNLGALYLELFFREPDSLQKQALFKKATYHLEISKNIGESAENYYNLALLKNIFEGEDIKTYLKKALDLSDDKILNQKIKSLLAVVLMGEAKSDRDKKYKQAAKMLSETSPTFRNLFNKGLAHLLAGEYDEANQNLEKAKKQTEVEQGLVYYVQAINEIRKGNEEACLKLLQKACEIEPKFKKKATKDLEFERIALSKSFTDLLK